MTGSSPIDFSPIDFSSELENSSTLEETAEEEDVDLGLDTFSSCPMFVLDFGFMLCFHVSVGYGTSYLIFV